MLVRAISLNLKIASTQIFISFMVLMFSGILWLMMNGTSTGVVLALSAVAIAVTVIVKGYCRIFCTSYYDDEASLYMALPIENETMILGKALACTIWVTFALIFLVVTSIGFLEMYHASTNMTMFLTQSELPPIKETFVYLIDVEMTPLQTAISMGLVPTTIAISICVGCFFIMAFQQFVGQSREKKSKPNMVAFAIFIFVGLNIGVWFLMNKLEGIGVDRFLISLGAPILYIGVGAVLYFYCKKRMDGSY